MAEKAKMYGIKENRKEIMEIAEATQKSLSEDFNITITRAEGIPTIAAEFVKHMWEFLNKNKNANGPDIEINFLNMFQAGVSHLETADGEKDGNFTPYMNVGQIPRTIIKSDEMTEDEDM